MAEIILNSLTGGTSPYKVYVADVFGNHETLIATLGVGAPPQQFISVPSIFTSAPAIMLKIIDNLGNMKFKILPCIDGCLFNLTISAESCDFNISLVAENYLVQTKIIPEVSIMSFSLEV
jgi:hypothetical protein